MPGKSNVYTLGEMGVNRVLSPVHLIDGELLAAQNADVPFEKGNRGLRKRSGMAKLNTDPAAGAILSHTWVPLPDPFGASVYAITSADPTIARVSDDGFTFTTVPLGFSALIALNFDRALWYYSGGHLFSYDGVSSIDHGADAAFADQSITLVGDDTNNDLVVVGVNHAFGNLVHYRYHIGSGTWTSFLPPFGPGPSTGAVALSGTVYVGGDVTATTNALYRTTNTGVAPHWILDTAYATNVATMDLAVFNGKVYVANVPDLDLGGVDPNINKIMRRDGVGVMVSVLNVPGQCRSIAKAGSRIYATHVNSGVSSSLYSSNDGASWAIELDLTTLGYSLVSGGPSLFEWNDNLYLLGPQGVHRRSAAGVFTLVDATPAANLVWL